MSVSVQLTARSSPKSTGDEAPLPAGAHAPVGVARSNVTAAAARKWRHKYMVELLRRASLERRNMQLARQASRLSPHDVAVPPAEVRPLLWDPWEDPGELHELTLPRALARPRLAHLDLAGR